MRESELHVCRSPDGLVEGSTEQLAAVLAETEAGDTFTVGTLKAPQALATLDLPYLSEERHEVGKMVEWILTLNAKV